MPSRGMHLLAAGFPVADAQFWIVSAIVLLAAAYLLRGVLPIPYFSGRAERKKQERRATLTVGGRPLDAPKPAITQPNSPEAPRASSPASLQTPHR